MEGFLILGFVIGMQHALEADHVAAVGSMATDGGLSRRGLTLRGAVWGLGHTITLFAICSAVLLLGLTLTDQTAAALEFGVGVMLVLLGADVVRRMRAKKVHFHIHRHGEAAADARPHIHAHSHANDPRPHDAAQHDHRHRAGFPLKALFIGLIHGAAGSAGLLALAVASTKDPVTAVGYVALFGLGSILGMAFLTLAASWPLLAAERHALLLHRGLSYGAAGLALILGVSVMLETGPTAWGSL